MSLDFSNVIQSPLKAYEFELKKFDAGSFPSTAGGTLMAATIGGVSLTSDVSPDTFTFQVNDDTTTENTTVGSLVVPEIGDEILLSVTDVGNSSSNELFKGFVVGITHQKDENGAIYSIECNSMKSRLSDEIITKFYNEQFDNVDRPNFDDSSGLLKEQSWTVQQIIEDIIDSANSQILSIPSAYQPLVYFSKADMDFGQVPELSTYVPKPLNFENTSVLQAIYSVITSAGPYRMVFDPRQDKIVFTKVSIEARGAGSERPLYYAASNKAFPNRDYVTDAVSASNGVLPSGQVNVIRDNSVRRVTELATVYRVFGEDIDWYSGHYYIEKGVDNFNMEPNASGVNHESSINWDGYKYIFDLGSTRIDNKEYFLVGCPLFPDWLPASGFAPHKVTLGAEHGRHVVIFDKDNPQPVESIETQDYNDKLEVRGCTENDAKFSDHVQLLRYKDANMTESSIGHIYEAWYPWVGTCLYCGGSGAVESTAPWEGNESEWFGDSRYAAPSGGFSIGDRKRPSLVPFDYAFVTRNGENVPTKHPVPWVNMCPACRGVGREPRFKIRNINNSLVNLPPSKVRIEDTLEKAVVDRDWTDLVKDYTYAYVPIIHVEDGSINIACGLKEEGDEMPPHPLAGLKPISFKEGSEDSISEIYPQDEKMLTIFKTGIKLGNGLASIDFAKGNVIFNTRQAIMAKKANSTTKMQRAGSKTFVIKKSGTEETEFSKAQGNDSDQYPAGYWRPSRAWMVFYFKRDRFYDVFPTEGSEFNSSTRVGMNPRLLSVPVASGAQEDSYKIQGSIYDGKYYCELYKQSPEDGVEFDARPVVKGVSIPGFKWQISPDDVYNLPVPESWDYDWSASGTLKEKYIDNKYYFPNGAVHVIEPLRYSEYQDNEDFFKKDYVKTNSQISKKVSWVQRDDRYRLIQQGVRELEKANNIQISGSITIRGVNYNLGNGMGYVHFEDGLKAVIVKISHSFSGTYTTTLELSTEEFRLGEKPERDKDTERIMNLKLSNPNLGSISTENMGIRQSYLTGSVVFDPKKEEKQKDAGHLNM